MKNVIKKILIGIGIALLVLMILGTIGQYFMKPEKKLGPGNTERAEFERMIALADADCPIPAAMGQGAVTGIKLEGDYVTYYISYEPDMMNVLAGLGDNENVKEAIVSMFLMMNAQGNNGGDVFMDVLDKFGYGLRVVITDSNARKFDVKVTSADIAALRERLRLNPHEALHNFLTIQTGAERQGVPMDLGNGMVKTDCRLESPNIVYEFELDEDIYSIPMLRENSESAKGEMFSSLMKEPDGHALLDLCKVSHSGIVYRMVGNQTRQMVDIELSADEIRQNVATPATVNIN